MIDASYSSQQLQLAKSQLQVADIKAFDQKQDIQANSLAKEQLDTETFKAIMYEDAGAALIQRSKMDLKELEVRSKQLLDLQDVSRQRLEIKAYLQESKLDTKRTVDEIV